VPLNAYDDVVTGAQDAPGARDGILFVGGFGHPPNIDGALWFVREVLPVIRETHPDVPVVLAGSNPTDEVRALESSGVTVTGFVSDEVLAELYRTSRVAIAPLRFGGGVKGKVIEAMRHGLPQVTTSTGVQGLDLTKDFVFAEDTAEGFAARVVQLLSDDTAWLARSTSAQAFVREHFSADAVFRVLANDLPPPVKDEGMKR